MGLKRKIELRCPNTYVKYGIAILNYELKSISFTKNLDRFLGMNMMSNFYFQFKAVMCSFLL